MARPLHLLRQKILKQKEEGENSMKVKEILSLVEDILSKGILKNISKYGGIIADEIVGMVDKSSTNKLLDEIIKEANEDELPNKALFIQDLKEEWDTIPERTRTKLLIMLYIEKKFMNNVLTDIILSKIYYDYITS